METTRRPKARPNLPFDPEVLSQKLEQVIIAREKRAAAKHALQSTTFVVRNAASQFTATTTPLAVSGTLGRHSTKLPSSAKPDGSQHLHPFARRPSESPASVLPRETSTTDPLRRGSDQATYKPGDAAARRNADKRRSAILYPMNGHIPPQTREEPQLQSHPAFRLSRDRENDMPYTMPMPDETTTAATLSVPARPRLSSTHDRSDWTQSSQRGAETPTLLSLWSKKDRSRKDQEREAAERKAPVAAACDGYEEEFERIDDVGCLPVASLRLNHYDAQTTAVRKVPSAQNLVGDAVKAIKREERMKRRRSIVGLFRRF